MEPTGCELSRVEGETHSDCEESRACTLHYVVLQSISCAVLCCTVECRSVLRYAVCAWCTGSTVTGRGDWHERD